MTITMITIVLCICLLLVNDSDARRCFECHHVATPHACRTVTDCNSDEYCFTEQFVTQNGNVAYNSGCTPKMRCSTTGLALVGKKSIDIMVKRVTDISTCIDCCLDDFCNMDGCGAPAIQSGQRGTYCYNCNSIQDPKECRRVTPCDQDEVCVTYSENKVDSLQHTTIRSHCMKQTACDLATQTFSNFTCAPYCCTTDFCNDRCGTIQNARWTTRHPHTLQSSTGTTTTQIKVTTAGPTIPPKTCHHITNTHHCNANDGYMYIHNENVRLCVHFVLQRATWVEARAACKRECGDLVILDTHDKAKLIRHEIFSSSRYYTQYNGFWIGARDFHHHKHFSWVDNKPVDNSVADWDDPNRLENQDCVIILKQEGLIRHDFRWHDMRCEKNRFYFICER